MTKIEWADRTINPVTGCTPISPGCQNCYAKRMAKRLAGRCGYPGGDGFAVTIHLEKMAEIEALAKIKKPQRVFLGSMTDLFHEDISFEFLRKLWATISNPYLKHHTIMILTKRPERARNFFDWMNDQEFKVETFLPNVWLGVTAENQEQADKRIPILLGIPSTMRFVSVEPMLEPVFFPAQWLDYGRYGQYDMPTVNWVICGGETGPGARPMHPDWVRNLRDQCKAGAVPFFFKHWGEYVPCDSNHGGPDSWTAKGYSHCTDNGYDGKPIKSVDGYGIMIKVGKKKAGRILDGREWNDFPVV